MSSQAVRRFRDSEMLDRELLFKLRTISFAFLAEREDD